MKAFVFYNFLYKNNVAVIEKQAQQLPVEMLSAINRYQAAADRQRRILSRLLLVHAIDRLCPAQKESIHTITRLAHNKPVFKNSNYQFSVTHSGELCAVVVTKNIPVGIDAEFIKPVDLSLMQDWLHENEIKQVSSSLNSTAAFYEIWTRKEAIIKAAGTGLTETLKDIDTTRLPVPFQQAQYYCYPVALHPDYRVHIAASAPVAAIETTAVVFA